MPMAGSAPSIMKNMRRISVDKNDQIRDLARSKVEQLAMVNFRAEVKHGLGGAWVEAWVWVSEEEIAGGQEGGQQGSDSGA